MADDPDSSNGEAPWDRDSQPSEDAGIPVTDSAQSEGIPSATESVTTESSSITKALQDDGAASVNANGPGKEHHGKVSRRTRLADEIERVSKEKLNHVMKDKEPDDWKREIQLRMEREIDQRVRDALETPPLERMQKNKQKAKMRKLQQQKHDEKRDRSMTLDECNSYAQALPSLRNKQPWNKDNSFRYYETDQSKPGIGPHDRDSESANRLGSGDAGQSRAHSAWGDGGGLYQKSTRATEIHKSYLDGGGSKSDNEADDEFRRLSEIRKKTFHRYTAEGFKEALKAGKLKLKKLGNGRFMDKNGVVLSVDGPFWPPETGPLYGKPEHVYKQKPKKEPLSDAVAHDGRTVHTQRISKWYRPWEQITQVVYDSERTAKGTVPHQVPEGCSPSLVFESRFESGNLRQARRIGQFEYDLVLRTDLYTNRHTQWYYFRIQRMLPGITYKFNIVNLLKKDSLYNHGMRPLLYSEKEAEISSSGWMRTGHHISYTRNYGFNRNALLHPEMIYYVLEWQMEFKHENDTCFFAHCYPYTFTDLRDHLETLISEPERRRCMKREILCETRAGNSCFMLTVSNFSEKSNHEEKKAVVVSARVHPGETNASWIMKGLLDFITSSDPVAKQLRELFIFKIIPMLNPDGVIVGNYRCSLSARDLNRNYRHPKKESFPTVWHLKSVLQELNDDDREVVVFCDLHGHSRKHNVFIYGCDPQSKEGDAASFLYQRLFPWLMSRMAPDKFSFRGCKFNVKRCKESTGRVVMWRQMNIPNSFTMEATFCGAKNMESIDMPRHFNTSDYQDLGRHFCEALLEYHKAQQNKSLHSELILELTREITHQVLQSRGLLPLAYNGSEQESESSGEERIRRRQRYHQQTEPRQAKSATTTGKTQVPTLPAIKAKSAYSAYFKKSRKEKAKSTKGKKPLKKKRHRHKKKSKKSLESMAPSDSVSEGSEEEEEQMEEEEQKDRVQQNDSEGSDGNVDISQMENKSDKNIQSVSKKKVKRRRTRKEAVKKLSDSESSSSSSSSSSMLLDQVVEIAAEGNKKTKRQNQDEHKRDIKQMLDQPHMKEILNMIKAFSKTDSVGKSDSTQSKSSSGKEKSSSTHEGVRTIQSRLEAMKMIDALSSETIKGCIHILQDLKILREFVESDTSDSDSASESEQPNNEPDEEVTKQNKKRKKKRSKKSRGVTLPGLVSPDNEESNTGGKTKTSASSSGKFANLKKYPPFVNRYINRSNNGIPMFSQERLAERNIKRLSTIQKIQKESQMPDGSQFNDSEEYARLVAFTKQIQEQEAEVRFKMTSSPTGAPNSTPFKHPFTHSNSFHGLQQSAQSPRHHLRPMDPTNTGSLGHKLQRSHTMIQPSRQLGQIKDHRGLLGNHYHGNELSTPMMDSNNNDLQSSDTLLTNELSRTLQMHHGKANEQVPKAFEQRTPLQLNMKQQSSTNQKLSRPSLSAALPINPSYNTANSSLNPANPSYNPGGYKGSTLRHKTAPAASKMAASTAVNRGHAADLISQQYNQFLSQTHKVPSSAAARYLESLTKSLSKNGSSSTTTSSSQQALSETNTNGKEPTTVKKTEDLQAKTML